tara:strand:+ start:2487 stop:3032 length:546 start_codon:yes stop_codon:yes gene_type:complete
MNNVIIGKNTNFAGSKNLSANKNAKIIIKKYCAIADGISIFTVNHDPHYPAIQGIFYKDYFNSKHPGELKYPPSKERTKGNVIIGNNVWIGRNVFIGSGVTIGDGAIIGANSVVTKNIPSYHMACGNPCVIKKKIFDDDKIKFLLDLKWWDWDENKIKKNKNFFFINLTTTCIDDLKKIIK